MSEPIISSIQADPVHVDVVNTSVRVTSQLIQQITRVTESLVKVTGVTPEQVIIQIASQVVRVTGVQPNYPTLIKAGIQGPQGLPGLGSSNYKSNIEPSGIKNEINTIFTFPDDPLDPTFELYINGLLEDPLNYTLVGNQLTLTTAPRSWWRISACYFI